MDTKRLDLYNCRLEHKAKLDFLRRNVLKTDKKEPSLLHGEIFEVHRDHRL